MAEPSGSPPSTSTGTMSRRCVRVLTNLPRDSSKPTAVICHTVKGKGIAFAENNMAWHHQNKVTAQDAERLLAALEAR